MKFQPTVILIVLICLLTACSTPEKGQESPAGQQNDNNTEAVADLDAGEQTAVTDTDTGTETPVDETPASDNTLPFTLLINGEPVGSDLSASAEPGIMTNIEVMAPQIITGNLSILEPDGTSIYIGEWQSEMGRFIHNFPAGENHLILTVNEILYDVVVMSGDGTPTDSEGSIEFVDTGERCSDAFLEIGPASRWEFRETENGIEVGTWTWTVMDWTPADTGGYFFKLLTEKRTGVENNVIRTGTLDLACSGEDIMIYGSVEEEAGTTTTIVYMDNTVYLPGRIEEGISWVRRGIMTITDSSSEVSYDLMERMGCVGIETIATGLGEFEAYRIQYLTDCQGENDQIIQEGTWWIVPGIGRVLTQGTMEGIPTLEMTSYEL